ncbi:DNA photolyase, FAD-binding/Cryptochrome [Aspergillus falconensis]
MPQKRKLSNGTDERYHPNAQQTAEFGIVLRGFYPPEMSNARCEAYSRGILERPIETWQKAYTETSAQRNAITANAAVVHWFKSDLRLHDNRALQMAYKIAQEYRIPLIGLYILSPEDLTAHLSSPARVDLTLRTLEQLKRDLGELDVPLYMETQAHRKDIPRRIIALCQEWGVNHLFANLEYEVDELRREAKLIRLCAQSGIRFETAHDTCVVPPGLLSSQQGKQYAVYSPWFRSWLAFLNKNPEYLEASEDPTSNPGDARRYFKELFECPVPGAPENKRFDDAEKADRIRRAFPAGEHEGLRRLEAFLKEKATAYDDERNFLSGETTSILSPYFTCGSLSARTAVAMAREANGGKISRGEVGYISWISEVAWRDFYKHVLVHWPFICMNKCFKPEFTNLDWSYNSTHFEAWSTGKTGYPLVDAAMRQLHATAWMHNRCRMVVSSFLSKDLLIDWRRGERYFMEHLIDGDFASNHGGWGFGSSTGVDPQPYFRVFNPIRQSERFDPEGDYIRRWVPELREVDGNAIHAPYERGAGDIARANGYPEPIVDHLRQRDIALRRYKDAAQGR